jgi:peptidoglycan/xylan/chitin deacetylase (PgdA/CDA1 family)
MKLRKIIFVPVMCLLLSACSQYQSRENIDTQSKKDVTVKSTPPNQTIPAPTTDSKIKNQIINKYQGVAPKEWGENVTGVLTHLNTNEKVIALTFDACGGPHGSGYDAELIYFLRQWKIPATLFINYRWIDANYWTFMALSKLPQFEIENHGYLHRPLSVNGKSAWGITGTASIADIIDEVQMNHRKIQSLTGKTPKFFRSGTAYYDDVAVKVVNDLGERPVNYNVLGDAGATFNKDQVKNALLSAKPGSIVIMHMNQPTGETAEGVKAAIPELINKGYRFVKLTEFPLKLAM